jgi:hypothetical protein
MLRIVHVSRIFAPKITFSSCFFPGIQQSVPQLLEKLLLDELALLTSLFAPLDPQFLFASL